MNILGIDYGTVRIGLAIAEDGSKIARTLNPIVISSLNKKARNNYRIFNTIKNLIQKLECNKVIIGAPFYTEYSTGNKIENYQVMKVKRFAKSLKKYLIKHNIYTDILLVDESFSTIQAYENLKILGTKSKKIRKKIDSESAKILLQNYLDNNIPHIKIDAQT